MADLWASCVSENKQKHRPDLLFKNSKLKYTNKNKKSAELKGSSSLWHA